MRQITAFDAPLMRVVCVALLASMLTACNMPVNPPPAVTTAVPMQVNRPTPPPTPSSRFADMPPGAVITLTRVGGISANTPVRISTLMFDQQAGWVYEIATLDDKQFATATDSDLALAPGFNPAQPTPPARYQDQGYWGDCYTLVAQQDLPVQGAPISYPPVIEAGTRVRVSSMLAEAIYQGNGQWTWFYDVVQEGGLYAARAREDQLAPAPGIDPQGMSGPTPTAPFVLGMAGYNYVTREDVGEIAAGTPVSVGSGRLGCNEWLITIIAEDGRYAEARAGQIQPLPGFDPYAPTPTSPPVPPTP